MNVTIDRNVTPDRYATGQSELIAAHAHEDTAIAMDPGRIRADFARHLARAGDEALGGTWLARGRRMHALGVEGELLGDDALCVRERPTIPVPGPRESGVCLKVTRVPLSGATVDAVVCDLSRDPRSEDYAPDHVHNVSPLRRRGRRARRLML